MEEDAASVYGYTHTLWGNQPVGVNGRARRRQCLRLNRYNMSE